MQIGCRIVIVEPNDALRKLLDSVVRAQGFDVVATCADGAAALERAASLQPDVVLLDLVAPMLTYSEYGDFVLLDHAMHDVSGYEVIRELRDVAPDARVLAWSSTDARDAYLRALAAGADDFLDTDELDVRLLGEHLRALCSVARH